MTPVGTVVDVVVVDVVVIFDVVDVVDVVVVVFFVVTELAIAFVSENRLKPTARLFSQGRATIVNVKRAQRKEQVTRE